MFANCIFCANGLGANESLSHFPVGKRLAYDAAKGRLWVVCPKCERWNLSPLEERWEAIEEAEKLYRDTKKRVATENIGLAKLHDGTTLVRIGAPLRPEFAAWRYGDQFGRRKVRQWQMTGGGVGVPAAVLIGGPLVGIAVASTVSVISNSTNVGLVAYQRLIPRVRVANDSGFMLPLTTHDLRHIDISGANDISAIRLDLPLHRWTATGGLLSSLCIRQRPVIERGAQTSLEGPTALRALASILPALNRAGGSKSQIQTAVNAVEHTNGSLERLIGALVAAPRVSRMSYHLHGSLSAAPKPLILALEMAIHEEDERRAFQGELHELELRWRAAEEIAGIADSLTLPDSVDAQFESLRSNKND